MTAPKIDSHFAEDLLPSDDRDLRSVEAMFERFLKPNWEDCLSIPVGRDRIKSPARYCPIDILYPEPSAEELLKIAIDLALATLEAAETALFAKFNVADIDPAIAD